MVVELRPRWCLDDQIVEQTLAMSQWRTSDGRLAADLDGDTWRPGQPLTLSRVIEPPSDLFDLRRNMRLLAGQKVGIAARWTCRATDLAGVHTGGPEPIELTGVVTLSLDIPGTIGSSIEIETCLISWWVDSGRSTHASPSGALIWSDGWTRPVSGRSILLEGDELRIPVRTISFSDRYGTAANALWAIELDTTIELDDRLSNVVTVQLNRDVLVRDFPDAAGEPNADRIPDSLLCGVKVDLVRTLTAAVSGDLNDEQVWSDFEDGTVGSLLLLRLQQAFGSVSSGVDAFLHDQPTYSRRLNDLFAPTSWLASK